MKRRNFIGCVGISVTVGGCVGDSPSGFDTDQDTPDVATDPDDHDENEDEVPIEQLRLGLNALGLTVLDISVSDAVITVDVQTTGNFDEDVRGMAGAYAEMAPELDQNLRVRVEDRGLTIDTFEIQREWALDFVADQITDQEYLEKIHETMNA